MIVVVVLSTLTLLCCASGTAGFVYGKECVFTFSLDASLHKYALVFFSLLALSCVNVSMCPCFYVSMCLCVYGRWCLCVYMRACCMLVSSIISVDVRGYRKMTPPILGPTPETHQEAEGLELVPRGADEKREELGDCRPELWCLGH